MFPSLFQQTAPAPPQSVTDSLAADTVGVDTLGVDTTRVAASDSVNTLAQFNQDLGETAELLFAGQWQLFWNRLYEGLANLFLSVVPKVFKALFVFALFYILYRVLRNLLNRVLDRSKHVDAGLQSLISKTYRIAGLTFIAVMVLAQLDVNVSALLAGLGIAGIAVGFAARDTLENFLSGVTILFDKPFRIGDNVEVADGFGTVEEITLRSTRLRTLQNQVMVMPNTQMVNQPLINHTMLKTIRVDVHFGIAYKEYPQEARKVALALTEGDTRLHDAYPPKVAVTGLNDSSVDMVLRLYLKDPKLEVPVRDEYTEKVLEALRAAGIQIPFPHLQLFIDEAKAFENTTLLQPLATPSRKSRSKPSA